MQLVLPLEKGEFVLIVCEYVEKILLRFDMLCEYKGKHNIQILNNVITFFIYVLFVIICGIAFLLC